MGIGYLLSVAARDPVEASYVFAQRIAPSYLVTRLAKLGSAAGIRKPMFLLSFDCDTDKDIDVGWDVHAKLMEMGILPVYAVPGENLERGAVVWRRIADTGAEFINHGYREHTILNDGKYVSTVFYDQLTPDEVAGDIRRGHDAVVRVTGQTPDGFRAPHFGTYKTDAALRDLHRQLGQMGYRFSTSTVPYFALRHGPLTRKFGLLEMPVTGCPQYPLAILDSYTFRFASNGLGPEGYVDQMTRWAELLEAGQPLFINLYVDPSQVYDWPEFFSAIGRLAPFSRSSYGSVIDEVSA